MYQNMYIDSDVKLFYHLNVLAISHKVDLIMHLITQMYTDFPVGEATINLACKSIEISTNFVLIFIIQVVI